LDTGAGNTGIRDFAPLRLGFKWVYSRHSDRDFMRSIRENCLRTLVVDSETSECSGNRFHVRMVDSIISSSPDSSNTGKRRETGITVHESENGSLSVKLDDLLFFQTHRDGDRFGDVFPLPLPSESLLSIFPYGPDSGPFPSPIYAWLEEGRFRRRDLPEGLKAGAPVALDGTLYYFGFMEDMRTVQVWKYGLPTDSWEIVSGYSLSATGSWKINGVVAIGDGLSLCASDEFSVRVFRYGRSRGIGKPWRAGTDATSISRLRRSETESTFWVATSREVGSRSCSSTTSSPTGGRTFRRRHPIRNGTPIPSR
jgi:hypothetical protein